jgi:hypothetical protein
MVAATKEKEPKEEAKKEQRHEEFRLSGDDVLAKIKELVHEGNVRRIIIKSEKGNTLLEVPLTIGVVGVALLPIYAAIGALAALITKCTIVVERKS